MQDQYTLSGTPFEESTVEEYKFQPIKGYPMLNWRGKRPFTATQFYPAQKKEEYGEPVDGWMNKIFWGDNLQVMSHLLKGFRGKIDLIYIDPPFDSQADYKKRIKLKSKQVVNDSTSFEEKQYTDIWTNDEYLQFMYERIVLLRELLSDKGTIWLHCDYRKGYLLKAILDEVFGAQSYITEVIWKRASARGNVKKGLSVAHDQIFVYGKTDQPIWTPPRCEYSEEYIARFSQVDSDGRRYTLDNMISPNPDRPNLDYEWNGVRRVWRVTKDRMRELHNEGRLGYTSTGVARFKRFLDELEGQPLTTLWDDIDAVNSQARERVNYPTQKPVKLLERIIHTASTPGGIVFDCFMGSGTTQSAAMKLGRKFIGADINVGSVQTTTKRLISLLNEMRGAEESESAGFEVYNVNNYEIFRNPVQAKELLLEALEIQPLAKSSLFDGEKDGKLVKILPVNRIATKSDLNSLINGFDYSSWQIKQNENPNQSVESILLVCMGHEPDLKAHLELEVKPFKLNVEVVDILRDKSQLEFKRDSEAVIEVEGDELIISKFYPMNLLQKLSLQKEKVEDWREMVESIMIDWNYDGAILQPSVLDVPDKNGLVEGRYKVPADAGTIRVKITDLLSESWEGNING